MKKVGLFVALIGALACASVGVQASLFESSDLSFDIAASNFGMVVNPGNPPILTPIGSLNGIYVGGIGFQPGTPAAPDIDNPWNFFGSDGVHQTTSPVGIIDDDGAGTVHLNFSGWSVFWNGNEIPMGSGAWQGNAEGVADMICGNACESGDTYTLDYSATVPSGSLQGDQYNLHLEGTIVVKSQLPPNAKLDFDIATSKFGMATPQGVLETSIGSHDGIILGTAQPATGSHPGAPDGTESPGIDEPWDFFQQTGMSQTTAPVTLINGDDTSNVTLDFSGWSVTWNGIADIPLGSGTWAANPDGQAVMSCASVCQEGDTFHLDYSATVPANDPSGFGGAQYSLSLDGTIGVTGPPPAVPVTKDDSVETKPNTEKLIDVLKNDSSPDGLDCTSVTVVTNPVNGTATVDTDAGSADCGSITYLPNVDFKGTDTMVYTVASNLGAISRGTDVTVKVKSGDGGNSNGCTMSTNNTPYQGEWWLLAGFVAWLGWRQHNQRNRKMH